jgi:hypothetical protein
MKIGIIGAGKVGANLGKGWVRAGHEIMFSSRDPQSEKMQQLVVATGDKASAGTVSEVMDFADVIAVAISWPDVETVVMEAGDWRGKILIDVTNRFSPTGTGNSAAEDLARVASGAHVVKAFNTIGAERYLDPKIGRQTASMFICGDDDEAKSVVGDLVEDLEFDLVDVGPLSHAEMLESLAKLWVTLMRGGFGRTMAFKLLRE